MVELNHTILLTSVDFKDKLMQPSNIILLNSTVLDKTVRDLIRPAFCLRTYDDPERNEGSRIH